MQKTDSSQENHNPVENSVSKTEQKSRLPAVICIELLVLMSIITGFSVWKWQRAEQHTIQMQRDLLKTQSQLGDTFLQLNQPLKALNAYQKTLHLSESLAQENPENHLLQRDLSVSLERMGFIYNLLNHPAMALDFYQRCLTIRKTLSERTPNDFNFQRDLFVGFTNLGNVYQKTKQNQLALLAFQQALQIAEKSAQDKANFLAQTDLIWVRTQLTQLHD